MTSLNEKLEVSADDRPTMGKHPSVGNDTAQRALPVIADCDGCGVCCFHMGYPAFRLPRAPMSPAEIEQDSVLSVEVRHDRRRQEELLAGYEGESYWRALPEKLRQEWLEYVAAYEPPTYGTDPATFDGPCFWLDLKTRRCQHHQYRPSVCRDFETGNSECLQWRDYYRDRIEGGNSQSQNGLQNAAQHAGQNSEQEVERKVEQKVEQ